MDDELQQLEAELKQLRPVAPAARLMARVARELTVVARQQPEGARVHWLRWVLVPAIAAAAALAVMLVPVERPAGGTERGGGAVGADGGLGGLKPVAAENVLVGARDEGLVTLADGTPARRARLQYVDTITWKNPRTNASLTWTVPREEVRVVPIALQ